MKRLITAVLLVTMLLTVSITALADNACCQHPTNMHHDFEISELCSTDAKTMRMMSSVGCERLKATDDQRIYVYHTTYRGVSNMTNFFVPTAALDMTTTFGSKWAM